MIARAAAGLAASPRGRAALLAAAVATAGLLALSPGALAPTAARAALAALAVAAAALLVRRRGHPAASPPLAVLAREPLSQGAGLAVVETDGRRLLVGFGRDGVRLVLDLGRRAEGERP